jgi:hypothetical protein
VAALALAARLVVAFVLAVAAFLKLRAAGSLRGQVREFGVAAPLDGVVAVGLPVVELGVAAALVAFAGSPLPAFGTVALLALFTGAVVANVVRGRRVPCPCFGAGVSDAPVSSRTIVRNGWLLALAVAATGAADGAGVVPTAFLAALLLVPTAVVVRAARE